MEQYQVFQNEQIIELNKFLKLTNGEVVSYNPFVVKYDNNFKKHNFKNLFDNRFTIGYRNSVNLLTFHYNNILLKEIVITPTIVYVMDTKDNIYSIEVINECYKIKTYNNGKFIKELYPFDYDNDLCRNQEIYSISYHGDRRTYYDWNTRITLLTPIRNPDPFDINGGITFEHFKNKLIATCKRLEWIPLHEEINSYMSKKHEDFLQRQHESIISSAANRARKEAAKIIKSGLDNIKLLTSNNITEVKITNNKESKVKERSKEDDDVISDNFCRR